ncbi:hypothetical protein [Microbacterium sp. SD291]|uniref:hypothetical protein n=1 Tax=Microbacterium sp. SD291 TaxID=2782007 RepID=UPI001A97975F|nr:hypothetical protein [Microbacterium sp. SD291]MBO0982160.1 hypothetical protein [Microbacterium sp. SD291]
MSDEHPIIEDDVLGTLTRATTELTDGTVLTHDLYAGTIELDGADLELIIEGASAEDARSLLPRLRDIVGEIGSLRRTATDAVVTTFSNGEPEPHELDDAASDLTLDTVEAASDGTIVLHLTDTCGTHFPEGYWPAVHVAPDGTITQVTVES